MASMQAAQGLSHHLSKIECSPLIAKTVSLLADIKIKKSLFDEILPALPAEEVKPAVWREVVDFEVPSPSDFAENWRSEWHLANRAYLMPALVDLEDPHYPSDPADMIDAYAQEALLEMNRFSGTDPADWATIVKRSREPDFSHLSYHGEKFLDVFSVGTKAWVRGSTREASLTAMTDAALSFLEDGSIGTDPIFGRPYHWDPATRQFSPPAILKSTGVTINPITLPANHVERFSAPSLSVEN
jgi:hypothetical protein